MDHLQAAAIFDALGRRNRVFLFRLLSALPDGMTMRQLADALGVKRNHIWVNLSKLSAVGLVTFDKAGDDVVCRADQRRLQEAIDHLAGPAGRSSR